MTSSLDAPLELSTARLRLRKPRLEDAGPIFRAYARDEEVVRFVNWQVHESEEVTRDYLRSCLDEWSNGIGYPYVVEVRRDAAGPIGVIHLHNKPGKVQFGYVVARHHWGQGYATEALGTLVDWALAQPQIWRASAVCDVDNLASARVMEKAGMTFEGILRRHLVHSNISPEPRDCRVYAKVRPLEGERPPPGGPPQRPRRAAGGQTPRHTGPRRRRLWWPVSTQRSRFQSSAAGFDPAQPISIRRDRV